MPENFQPSVRNSSTRNTKTVALFHRTHICLQRIESGLLLWMTKYILTPTASHVVPLTMTTVNSTQLKTSEWCNNKQERNQGIKLHSYLFTNTLTKFALPRKYYTYQSVNLTCKKQPAWPTISKMTGTVLFAHTCKGTVVITGVQICTASNLKVFVCPCETVECS